ncbi:hypothetical protein K469DRAFT_521124, partial [Zopfia rhizophila CBS 207.26]
MQRDIALTFRDIHGSEEALRTSIKEIEQLALVNDPETTESLRLRFLTLRWVPEDRIRTGVVQLELTSPNQHEPGLEYVSVSYTWSHYESLEGRASVPEYQIWDPTIPSKPRPPRCPIPVLHRALSFAHARECPYVWIDQECINQEDTKDIENHLQVMHKIYLESRWTIAVLCCVIPSQSLIEGLEKFLQQSFFD